MRASLIFLSIVGFVTCSSPWQVNQQYEYGFTTNTLTGYGVGQDQYVGIVTKGKLILQPESESVVRGQLSQVRHAHFHDQLEDGLNSKIPERTLKFNEKSSPESSYRFSINYKNGVIRSLNVDPSLTNDDVNQLKAVLSQLQVDVSGENVIKCRYNQLPQEKERATNALYKTMEATVTGECETLYEMSPVPAFVEAQPSENWIPHTKYNLDENLLQLVKTVNYSNCDVRRGYHFGISGSSDMKPNSNQMGDFLSKSSVARVVISGPLDRFTIKSAETTNRVAVSTLLYDENKAEVVSRIALELESVNAVQSKVQIDTAGLIDVGNLVYRYNIPSDVNNQPRTSSKTYNAPSMSSISSDERVPVQRHRRDIDSKNYINKHNSNKRMPSSSSSFESSEEYNSPSFSDKYPHYYQPHPDNKEPTEQPLHPLTIGNKGRSIQSYESVDTVEEALRLVEEIANELQNQDDIPESDTLEKYTILSDLIQTMDYKQIEKMCNSRNSRQGNNKLVDELAKSTLWDATAQSGINPAISYIMAATLKGQIQEHEAAALLETAFKNMRTPTEKMLREIFEKIIKNDEISKQNSKYPNILVAYTDLLRKAYSNKDFALNYYPVQSFGSFEKGLGNIVTEEIIPWLGNRLAENIKKNNQQKSLLYIRALGNVAHPKIIGVFEQYLEDEKRATPFERLAIVAAFDALVESSPKTAKHILYKIYSNVAEEPEIRCMAVTLLMQTNPPASMLQRMAMSTYSDPSISVRTAVKSAINSAANLSTRKNAHLSENAKAAQKFLNTHTYGLQNAKTVLRDHVSKMLRISEEYKMSHIFGADSTFPKVMSYTSWKNLGGIIRNDVDVQALVSSVKDIWRTFTSNSNGKPNASGSQNLKYSVKNVAKQLGINIDSENSEEIAGQLLFKAHGQKSFMSFDKKSLKSLPKYLAKLAQELSNGRQLNFNKIYDHEQIVVAFPLATGYPFYYAFKAPILVQALGEVKVKTIPSLNNAQTWSQIIATKAVNTTAKVHLTLSMAKIGKAGFITPFERQRYVAGQIQKIQLHLPMNLNLNIDLKNDAVSGKITALPQQNNINLVHSSSVPFTARKDALSLRPVAEAKDVKRIETRPTVGSEHSFGQKNLGVALKYKYQHQFPQKAVNAMERLLQQEGMEKYAQLPVDIIATMQNLIKNRSPISPAQFLPYVFEPVTETTSTGKVLLSLLTAPFYNDLGSTGVTKLRAAMSLALMPYADASELKATTLEKDVSADGPWPLCSVASYDFTFGIDLQNSPNQVVKFGVQFDQVEQMDDPVNDKRTEKPLHSADESKLAVVSDISPNSQPRREEMMFNAARGMKQAKGAIIDSSISFEGSKPAKFVNTIAQANNAVGTKCRVLMFGSAKSATGGPAKQVYVMYQSKFANTPAMNYEEAERHDGKSNASLTVNFGEGGKLTNTKIDVNMFMQQSDNYKEKLRQTPVAQECVRQMRTEGNHQMPACLKATYEANLLDEIRMDMQVEQANSELKEWGHSGLSALNYFGYFNSEHDHSTKGSSNKIEAKINVNPQQHTMNLTLNLPSGTQDFTELSIPRSARYILSVYPGMDLDERMMRASTRNSEVCVIDQNKILTFDSAIAKHQKLGKCWYSVLQCNDCGDVEDEFSILVRQADQTSNEGNAKKEVLIVASGQRIQLSPSDDSNTPAKITVNNKPEQASGNSPIDVYNTNTNTNTNSQERSKRNNNLLARIYPISEKDLKVELHGSLIKLYYDGERIRVHADPILRSETAGLCGNYNGEEIDDIATPQMKVLQNQLHYSAAWAIPDENCAADIQQAQQMALAARSYPVEYRAGNVVSNYENGKNVRANTKANGQDSSSSSSSSSASSSSSSSSESNEADKPEPLNNGVQRKALTGPKDCKLAKRVQFVTENDQYCFTNVEVNACPNHCAKGDLVEVEVPAHCRDKTDSVATMFVQQIRRGSNPDLSHKPIDKNVTLKVPTICKAKQ